MAVAACAALGLSLALAGCNKGKAKADESGVRSLVTGDEGSDHFAAVAGHLDLGGTMFGYMDVDGDVEKIAGFLQEILDTAKQQAGADMPPQLRGLNLGDVVSELGLDGIEAMGLSSFKKGELYHNRAYVHIPKGRKGLLKVIGGDAGPFLGTKLAPKDSDLIVEYTLNIKAGYDLVAAMVTRFGGPDVAGEFAQGVSQQIPPIGVTFAELFGKLDTRLTMVGRIHPDKPLKIPDAPMQIPSFDAVIALDDVGWLYERITGALKEQMPPEQVGEYFIKGDGFERIQLPPVPAPEMVLATPVIHHDIANKRVYAASSAAFLDECLSGKSSVTDSDDFKAAMKGLPEEGNMMSFVTARFMTEYRKLIEGMVNAGPVGAAETAIVSTLLGAVMPDLEKSQASVVANLPEGILMASNAATSFKEATLTSVLAFLGAGSTAIFTVREAESHASDVEIRAIELEDAIQAREAIERPPAEPDDASVSPPVETTDPLR